VPASTASREDCVFCGVCSRGVMLGALRSGLGLSELLGLGKYGFAVDVGDRWRIRAGVHEMG